MMNCWWSDIRAESDIRNEKLGLKVREAQLQKIPYMIVIGDKEEEQRTISPRSPREKTGNMVGFSVD